MRGGGLLGVALLLAVFGGGCGTGGLARAGARARAAALQREVRLAVTRCGPPGRRARSARTSTTPSRSHGRTGSPTARSARSYGGRSSSRSPADVSVARAADADGPRRGRGRGLRCGLRRLGRRGSGRSRCGSAARSAARPAAAVAARRGRRSDLRLVLCVVPHARGRGLERHDRPEPGRLRSPTKPSCANASRTARARCPRSRTSSAKRQIAAVAKYVSENAGQ